jgi:hypothetical protein
VEAVLETWHIDEEWSRQTRVSRVYYSLLLEGGRTTTAHLDLVSNSWNRQA